MGESFYGGKQGFSFMIVKNFVSLDEMVNNFKLGPDYTIVHYDEYVLINSKNKNDPNNGKIFRRGYDYTNFLGGAIYIGTIVGPAGPAPMLEFTTIEDVLNKQNQEGYENRFGTGSYTLKNESLVPGKDINNNFNDKIDWAFCSIRDDNGEDCIAYIGFKIPYTVIDFDSESVNAYYNRSNNTEDFINQNLSERIDDKSHPFYERWQLKIPKGIKGDAFKNLRIMTADNTISSYDGQEDDIQNHRQVLVCDYYKYDKSIEGEKEILYLGDYNIITNITIDDDGSVIIEYSHKNSSFYNKILKWIDSIAIETTDASGIVGTGDQKIHVHYNTGETAIIGEPLNYILETTITPDYHYLVYYSSPEMRIKIVESGMNYSYNGKDDWLDLGSIKDDSGILIGLNIKLEEHPELSDILTTINYLNNLYPNGLTGIDLQGKIVSVGDSQNNKLLYAFDYSTNNGLYNGWYYLGNFGNININALFMVASENDLDIESKKEALSIGGLWFVLED